MGPRTSIKQTELSSLGFLNVEYKVKQLCLNNARINLLNNGVDFFHQSNFAL
jgi:hypothetical protein